LRFLTTSLTTNSYNFAALEMMFIVLIGHCNVMKILLSWY